MIDQYDLTPLYISTRSCTGVESIPSEKIINSLSVWPGIYDALVRSVSSPLCPWSILLTGRLTLPVEAAVRQRWGRTATGWENVERKAGDQRFRLLAWLQVKEGLRALGTVSSRGIYLHMHGKTAC